jgi:hypothetical protein
MDGQLSALLDTYLTLEQRTPARIDEIMYGLSLCSAFAPDATAEQVEATLKWLLSSQQKL